MRAEDTDAAGRPAPSALVSRALSGAVVDLASEWRRPAAEGETPSDLRGVLLEPHRTLEVVDSPSRITLAASLAVPLVVNLARPADRPIAFVQAPRTAPRVLYGGPAERYLEVWLDPLAAARLLRTPLAALDPGFVPVGDLDVPGSADLAERVRSADDDHARFALTDRYLRAAAAGRRDVPEQVAHAWRLLRAAGGRIPGDRLAAEVGWSQPHLVSRFAHHLGITPKRASRVMRLERLFVAARRLPAASWADLAALVGYADQAHLSREVSSLTGSTPAALRGTPPARMKNVQDRVGCTR